MLRVMLFAWLVSFSVASSAIASSITSSWFSTVFHQTLCRPRRSLIASTTDSSTVMPANRVLIWKVRVMPRLTRSCWAVW
jgi:hypothetical protein